MTDLVARIEHGELVGREFLLWLWFESEVLETNLKPSDGESCAMWIETRLALSFEEDEALLKSAAPATSPEAKQALRQGKLPREAKLHWVIEGREYGSVLKADSLTLSGVTVPAELGLKEDDVAEVLYERMRLLETLEGVIDALYRDFLVLRIGSAWAEITALMKRWAKGEKLDDATYLSAKKKALARRPKPKA